MKQTKFDTILDLILSYVKSKDLGIKKKVTVDQKKINDDISIGKGHNFFEFDINQTGMKFRFIICIYLFTGFFKNRYILNVVIRDPSKYSVDDNILFDSRKDKHLFVTMKEIFNILSSNDENREERIQSEKIEGFISDIKKSVDKSFLRDDKINDILSKK